MTLSAASALFYWSSRYDSIPIVGGKPVHARNSSATWIDQRGVSQSAIVNTPRFELADLGDGAGRRKVMRLEQSRTNLVVQSDAITAGNGWSVTTATPTAAYATRANRPFTRVVGAPTGAATINRSVTLTGNAVKAFSILVSSDGVNGTFTAGLYDNTAAVYRGRYTITVTNGVVTAVAVNGTVLRVLALADGVYRVECVTTTCTAANTNLVLAADGATQTIASVLVSGVMVEDAATPSSLIPTTTAPVTRAADSFYWDFTPPPQGMMIYLRFIERGTAYGTEAGVLHIGSTSAALPRLIIYYPTAGTGYRFLYETVASQALQTLAAKPALGAEVELLANLIPSGAAAIIDFYQSVNGAAVTSVGGIAAPAIPAAWAGPKLWLGSIADVEPGLSDVAEVKAVVQSDVAAVTPQTILEELRAFELSANGAQL